ncbi:MAG: chromate transporter [Candidatus Thermoplasmatota archaeon]|nr:chromate transporter [Candidatus Thermoplasmatota archaeon]
MLLLDLFLSFLKIGAFTFGGGYAMIPIVEKEVVESHHWLTQTEFTDVVAISEMTPGPIAVNSATFVGYKIGGLPGSIVATAGVVLPAFLIILLIATVFISFEKNAYVRGFMDGVKPAILALIVLAALTFAKAVPFGGISAEIRSAVIFGLVLVSVLAFKVHPVIALLVSGAIGIFWR